MGQKALSLSEDSRVALYYGSSAFFVSWHWRFRQEQELLML
jgi:hypothetical protein